MNQSQTQTSEFDQPPSQVIRAQFEISVPPKIDNHQLQLQQQDPHLHKALLFQKMNMQIHMDKTRSQTRPPIICASITHVLIIYLVAHAVDVLYTSDAYPIFELVHDHKQTNLDDILKTHKDCFQLFDYYYNLVTVGIALVIWGIISLIVVILGRAYVVWISIQSCLMICMAVIGYMSGRVCKDKTIFYNLISLPAPPILYYFSFCVGGFFMLVVGRWVNHVRESIKKELEKKQLQSNQMIQQQGLTTPFLQIPNLTAQSASGVQETQNYDIKQVADLQKAELLQHIQQPIPKPQSICSNLVHIPVMIYALINCYIALSSQYNTTIAKIYNNKLTDVDFYLTNHPICYDLIGYLYWFPIFSCIFLLWTIVSLLLVAKDFSVIVWGAIQGGFFFLTGVLGYLSSNSSCNIKDIWIEDSFKPDNPSSLYYSMCFATVVMIIAGLTYVAQKSNFIKEEDERKNLEALLLAVE